MSNYFDGIEKGDRVWSLERGWGTVAKTERDSCPDFPILVQFAGAQLSFTTEGERLEDVLQTLFWDEIKIVPPPRLKRIVKKEIEV